METAAAVTTSGIAWPEVTNTTGMIDINSTDGKSYTTTTEPKLSKAFMAFYFFMRFLFSAFAIFGNTLTIIAVVRFKTLQKNTNFLICSLAVADMLGCLNFPMSLAHEVLRDKPVFVPLCLIHRTMGTVSVLMNLFSILGIAIDRYFYIAHGLHYPLWVTGPKIHTIIAVTWVLVITEITSIFVWSHHLAIGVSCQLTIFLPKLIYWLLFVPQSGALMILTICFYVAIGAIAYKQGKAITALNHPYDTYEASLNRQHKKIAKMMGTVLGAYFACYIPQIIVLSAENPSVIWLYFEKVVALIYWANIWLNPLIYAWKSVNFRVAFRKLLGIKPGNEVDPLNEI